MLPSSIEELLDYDPTAFAYVVAQVERWVDIGLINFTDADTAASLAAYDTRSHTCFLPELVLQLTFVCPILLRAVCSRGFLVVRTTSLPHFLLSDEASQTMRARTQVSLGSWA